MWRQLPEARTRHECNSNAQSDHASILLLCPLWFEKQNNKTAKHVALLTPLPNHHLVCVSPLVQSSTRYQAVNRRKPPTCPTSGLYKPISLIFRLLHNKTIVLCVTLWTDRRHQSTRSRQFRFKAFNGPLELWLLGHSLLLFHLLC